MLESILVYGLLMVVMIICGKLAADREGYMLRTSGHHPSFAMPEVILPIVLFATVFGARYDVGIDHLSYLEIFNEIGVGMVSRDDIEPGFRWLTGLFSKNGIHYFFYFTFFAFLQIFFVYYAFRRHRYLYPYLALLVMSGIFLGWMNVMRQNTVVCIFIWMVHFTRERKLIAYCIGTFLCSFFLHTSAVLLLPIYFLLRIKWDPFRNILVQIAGLLTMIALNLNATVFALFTDVNDIMNLIGYDDRFKNFDAEESTREFSYGPRALLGILVYIIVILYNKRLKKTYATTDFRLYYTLFYIGICFHMLFSGNHILQRPFAYFIGMSLPVYAYLLHYLWHRRQIMIHKVVFLLVIAITLLQLCMTVYLGQKEDSTLFQFFWQV